MTDRADAIIDALKVVSEDLGYPVEIDRVHEVSDEDCPLVVVRTGDEEAADFEGRSNISWDRIWKMDPTIEVYLREPSSNKQRAVLSKSWTDFLAAFDGSQVFDLMTHGHPPEVRREIIRTQNPAIVGVAIELGIYFQR